jgi:hypothetical protein
MPVFPEQCLCCNGKVRYVAQHLPDHVNDKNTVTGAVIGVPVCEHCEEHMYDNRGTKTLLLLLFVSAATFFTVATLVLLAEKTLNTFALGSDAVCIVIMAMSAFFLKKGATRVAELRRKNTSPDFSSLSAMAKQTSIARIKNLLIS